MKYSIDDFVSPGALMRWPSFTLVCPLYASIRAIESNTHANYQACLTYWVLCSLATILENMLAKLLARLPLWPYAKGILIILLVVPYFRGASFVYSHFIRPYISGIPQICGLLRIPKTKVCILNEQSDIVDATESYAGKLETEEVEKVVIYEGESKSNHYNTESDPKWPERHNKVQREWSCALCLVSTTSKGCLESHFRGKKHKEKEKENRRDEVPASGNFSFSLTHETEDRLTSLGNFTQINLVNLTKLSKILSPVTRSVRCKWKRPEFGWTKLNADGSISRDHAGFGGLLRDHKGNPICAYVSRAPGNDIFSLELWAIWRGLVLASGLGIKAIWIESDSMSAVKTINKEQLYGSRARSCLEHIWRLLKKFEKYKVSHSWRETNRAADHLAKMDLVGSDVVMWPVDFPDRLWDIVKEDAQGRWYCRG